MMLGSECEMRGWKTSGTDCHSGPSEWPDQEPMAHSYDGAPARTYPPLDPDSQAAAGPCRPVETLVLVELLIPREHCEAPRRPPIPGIQYCLPGRGASPCNPDGRG